MVHKLERFSERIGEKERRVEIQVNSMNDALKNRLWNVLDYFYLQRSGAIRGDDRIYFSRIFNDYFKRPVDELGFNWRTDLPNIREYFFGCEWYEVYDFIEFTANNHPDNAANTQFKKRCNSVLEQELSGYRFVENRITPISSQVEISEIEEALATPSAIINTHLSKALSLISDRKSPDYRNSIKESISAVEAICRAITQLNNATLGQALKKVEPTIGLHPALKNSFSSLYGYTSSADGIRHALLEQTDLSFEDAKYMLVTCSAFVNYLYSKATKAGIKLE